MEKYLNTGIKEIINKFPEAGGILDSFGIGCAPCNVGTCLLKDIVDIHNLSVDDESKLLTELGKIIYSDGDAKIPEIKRETGANSNNLTYSPPIKMLVNEHVLIKRLITLIPEITKNINIKTGSGKKLVLDCIEFIRFYADKFHHAKEEDILFKYFDEGLDIVKVMHEDHTTARSHVNSILNALKIEDKDIVVSHLLQYAELLTEHIKKEDEILYPWMDRNLSTNQVGDMHSKFNDINNEFTESTIKFESFINKLEAKFKN